ncbi:MAG: hypothetical protein J6P21_02005 [Clostridia bacterium]|nr:hypothetical protein [Clostridia bacterium]
MKKIRKIISVLSICSVMSSSTRGYLTWNRERTVALATIGISIGTVIVVTQLVKLFSGKKDDSGNLDNKNFDKREQNWIKILLGEKIQDKSFLFQSGEAFRNANDRALEIHHNFIQIFFPNLEESGYANQDLCLNKNLKKWQALMQDLELRFKIQKNLKLNVNRILIFFGFEVTLGNNSEIIKLNAKDDARIFVPDNDPRSHNRLRLTRVLKCLKLFGLDREYEMIMAAIENNGQFQKIMRNYDKDYSGLRESYKYWQDSRNTACLF